MVELKRPRKDDVRRALELLDDDAVLVSFSRPALTEARRLRPGMHTVQHVGFGVSIRGAADAWAAGFQDARVTTRGVRAALALGLVPLVYTVNDVERMVQLESIGVGGVFTDLPEQALRRLRADPR